VKRKVVSTSLSIILSAGLLAILFSRIRIEDLVRLFSRIHIPSLLAYFGAALTASVLRAWRYRCLLPPNTISHRDILLVTFIRNLFVDLFPARIGSLSYIYVLNRRLNFSFETAASTFVVGFIFDFITLGPFVILSVLLVGLRATQLSGPVLLFSAAFFLLLTALILWKVIPLARVFLMIIGNMISRFHLQSHKWARVVQEKTRMTITELEHIRKRRIHIKILWLSCAIRGAKYVSLYLLLLSLLRGFGLMRPDISFFKTILGITGAELTGALPIKGLAGFGTWESAWALTFNLLGIDGTGAHTADLAVLSGIGLHLITNLFEYSLGILSILWLAFYGKRCE